MATITYEGVLEDGEIRLPEGVKLPDRGIVYILVPDYPVEESFTVSVPATPRIRSPRLTDPTQAKRFEMTVAETTLR